MGLLACWLAACAWCRSWKGARQKEKEQEKESESDEWDGWVGMVHGMEAVSLTLAHLSVL